MTDHVKQGTDEWKALKCGKFSASRASDLMAKGKGGQPSATRANLIAGLACERMTGQFIESYHNGVMDRGNVVEAEAADAYAVARMAALSECGWIAHPTIPNVGCSPDRLVDDDGLLEAKCPSSMSRHMAALREGAHAKEHWLQAQFQLWCSGRAWCDVVSYDPRWRPALRLAITRVFPDRAMFSEFAAAIAVAEIEIAAAIRALEELEERAAA